MNITDFFKCFSDDTRLRILNLLKHGELCVCKIQEIINIPQSSLSHHLGLLKKSGLISSRKNGKWHHYSISNGLPEDKKRVLDIFIKLTDCEEIVKSDENKRKLLTKICI